MSYYKIVNNDDKILITSFTNNEVFYDYFRGLINDKNCMGLYLFCNFIFEKYTDNEISHIKFNIIKDYITNNTEEFFNIQYALKYKCFYVYFPDYAIVVNKDLTIYKINLKEPNTKIRTTSNNNIYLIDDNINKQLCTNFKKTYIFNEFNELKNEIINLLKKGYVSFSINDYIFCNSFSIEKVIVDKYIFDNFDTIFNNNIKTMSIIIGGSIPFSNYNIQITIDTYTASVCAIFEIDDLFHKSN